MAGPRTRQIFHALQIADYCMITFGGGANNRVQIRGGWILYMIGPFQTMIDIKYNIVYVYYCTIVLLYHYTIILV